MRQSDNFQPRRVRGRIEVLTIRTHINFQKSLTTPAQNPTNTTHLENRHMLIQTVKPLHGDVGRSEEELRCPDEQQPGIFFHECGCGKGLRPPPGETPALLGALALQQRRRVTQNSCVKWLRAEGRRCLWGIGRTCVGHDEGVWRDTGDPKSQRSESSDPNEPRSSMTPTRTMTLVLAV